MPTASAVSRAPALVWMACVLLSSSAFAAVPTLEVRFQSAPVRVLPTSCAKIDYVITDTSGAAPATYAVTFSAIPNNAPLEFFAGLDCAGGAVSSAVVSGGPSSVYVRSRDSVDRFALIRVAVTSGNESAYATQAIQVAERSPAALKIVGDLSVPPPVGACSPLMAVMFEDRNSFPVMGYLSGQPLTIRLATSSSDVELFSDAHCTTPAQSLAVEGNLAQFTYRGRASGNFNITASADGTSLSPVIRNVPVGTSSVPVGRVGFISPPQVIPARSDNLQLGSCSQPFVLQTQSGAGVVMAPTETLTVAVGATLSGSPTDRVTFYSDPKCTLPLSSTNTLKLEPGQTTVRFFASAARVSPYKVVATASTANAQLTASQPLEVAPGAPKALAFVKQPLTFISGQPQLGTSPIKVAVQDGDGNHTHAPGDITLWVTQSTEATASGATTQPLAEGIREAVWLGALTITGAAGAWESKTLTLTAKVPMANATPLTAQSDPFLLLSKAPPTPVFQLSRSTAARCETITATVGYQDAAATSDDVFKFCLDDASQATIEETTLTRDANNPRCVFGTLNGGKQIVFKNTTAQTSHLSIFNSLKTVVGARLSMTWTSTDTGACATPSTPTVVITVTLDDPSPQLGEEVLVDIRARNVEGSPAYAKAIKLVGGSLAIKELVDSSGAATLFAKDELRFASEVPDTIRLKATVTGSGEFTAVAVGDDDQELGKSEPLRIELEAPSQPASFGCATSGGSFGWGAVLLVAVWMTTRSRQLTAWQRARSARLLSRGR